MKVINDCSIMVAQATELIKEYIVQNDINQQHYLENALLILENMQIELTGSI
jgi:hypothetical protein